jgi:hypothetical protein
MVKTGVDSTGINIIAKAQLLNAAQALKIGMLDNIKYQLVRNGDKPMHRVVEYFAFVHCGCEEKPNWRENEFLAYKVIKYQVKKFLARFFLS